MLEANDIVQAITAAPGWARVGLTAPNERIRTAAAAELAQVVVRALDGPASIPDARQMLLPL